MKRREYIARFLGDLAKIVFGTVIISQFLIEKPNIIILIEGACFLAIFLGLSIILMPEDMKNE